MGWALAPVEFPRRRRHAADGRSAGAGLPAAGRRGLSVLALAGGGDHGGPAGAGGVDLRFPAAAPAGVGRGGVPRRQPRLRPGRLRDAVAGLADGQLRGPPAAGALRDQPPRRSRQGPRFPPALRGDRGPPARRPPGNPHLLGIVRRPFPPRPRPPAAGESRSLASPPARRRDDAAGRRLGRSRAPAGPRLPSQDRPGGGRGHGSPPDLRRRAGAGSAAARDPGAVAEAGRSAAAADRRSPNLRRPQLVLGRGQRDRRLGRFRGQRRIAGGPGRSHPAAPPAPLSPGEAGPRRAHRLPAPGGPAAGARPPAGAASRDRRHVHPQEPPAAAPHLLLPRLPRRLRGRAPARLPLADPRRGGRPRGRHGLGLSRLSPSEGARHPRRGSAPGCW